MEKSLIAAFKSMLTLQRWNLQPKVETWVEAENAMLVAHLAYGIAMVTVKRPEMINHLLFRILLKSLNKHYTTDISHFVTDKLKQNHESIWEKVINKYADKIAMLFPRSVSENLTEELCFQRFIFSKN